MSTPQNALQGQALFGATLDLEQLQNALSTQGIPHKVGEVRRVYVMPPGQEPKGGWSNAELKRLGTMVVFRAEQVEGSMRLVWKVTIPTCTPIERFWPTYWEAGTPAPPPTLVRRYAKRMDCMNPPDPELYTRWLAEGKKLDFPEWIVQQDNPGVDIPGLTWGHLWAGWAKGT
jgi:hypothetical protein